MRVAPTFEDARRNRQGVVGLVPTMGYLHEGHLALISAAREAADTVVVTLFVNPLQFDDAGDLERYPRDFERDATLAEEAGTDILFAPAADEMYPSDPVTRVHLEALTGTMEGAHRPGHFAGVATVVAKLFAGLQPDRAWFGRKDAQQLVVLTRMAADLSFPIEVIGHPTLREVDGLALSSRNVRIPGHQRFSALGLSRGLFSAADAVEAGERSGRVLESIVTGTVEAAGADLDYVALAAAGDLRRQDRLTDAGFLAVAARVGDVRLIDNIWVDPDGVVDRGIRLERRSSLYES